MNTHNAVGDMSLLSFNEILSALNISRLEGLAGSAYCAAPYGDIKWMVVPKKTREIAGFMVGIFERSTSDNKESL